MQAPTPYAQYRIVRPFDQYGSRKLWRKLQKEGGVPAAQVAAMNRYCDWLSRIGASFEVKYHNQALFVKSNISMNLARKAKDSK